MARSRDENAKGEANSPRIRKKEFAPIRRRLEPELMQLYRVGYSPINQISRLRWIGHVKRMDANCVPRILLITKSQCKTKAERPNS